jgi:predicted dehydrogenase/threonine dehydrogenase-like Zn-dependent dehydrogenase
MKQVLVRGGRVEVTEVPAPAAAAGHALIATAFSVISPGTEAALLQASGRSTLQRVTAHPSPFRKALQVMRDEGMAGVLRRLADPPGGADPVEVGYAAAGVVVEAGEQAGVTPGARVACAGAQCAHHAELISVPRHLLAPVPERVPLQDAAFATLGAIALHGFRRSGAGLGESVAVVGLGLVGLLAAQIARAAGCRVLAFDPDPGRVDLARTLGLEGAGRLGEEDPLAVAAASTGGEGADAVLVCAAARDSEPLALAMRLARRKAKIVVVGDVGMQVDRALMYAKELDLLISTSYGPGRYDPAYEEGGQDYPLPYVRWTEERNLGAVLRMMAAGAIRTAPLVEATWPLADAPKAYESIGRPGGRPAVLLRYPGAEDPAAPAPASRVVALRSTPGSSGMGVAVVGAGQFMRDTFLPIFRRHFDGPLVAVVSGTGAGARRAAERFGAEQAATDVAPALADPRVRLVLIGTRHHLHAAQVVQALDAGKAVFVEKPLCLTREELDRVRQARRRSGEVLAVGFNRRYAPLVRDLKRRLQALPGRRLIQVRVNAGRLPADHWTQDPRVGGGRLIGEGCHFIDLIPFLAGAPIRSLQATALPPEAESGSRSDTFSLDLELADGSLGSLLYTSLGDPSLPKERIEVHAAGTSMVLDDFRALTVHARGAARTISGRRDKGIEAEIEALLAALRGRPSELITWEEIEVASEWTLTAQERLSARERTPR